MPDSVNEILLDRGISHAVYLERYKASVLRDILSLLSQADKDIIEKLSRMKLKETYTKKYLEAQLRNIRAINRDVMKAFQEKVQKEFKDFSTYEATFQGKLLESTIPIQWNVTQVSPDQLYAAVTSRPFENALLMDHIRNIDARRLQMVEGAIRLGWAEGETIDQITRRIRGSRKLQYKDGILEKSRREIEALVRTAINHTSNVARNSLYQANEDLIKGIQYVATLDSRTTLICADLDGKVFDPQEGPRPPQHWRCRSTTVPVTKSWRELGIDMDEAPAGTRASMNGQVPATTNYEGWLKKQPEGVQIEVLGKKRYQLWKNGVPLGKFVSNGKILSLSELSELEGISIPATVKKPAVKRVPDFKSHRDASTWAVENKVATYSSFKGVHPKVARDWVQGAVDTQQRVPGLKMDFIGSAQERNRLAKDLLRPEAEQWASRWYESNTKSFDRMVTKYLNRHAPKMGTNTVAVSFWAPPLRGVGINTKFGKNPIDFNSMIERNNASGWWIKNDTASVSQIIAHEMGHEVDRMYTIRRDPRIIDLFRKNDIVSEVSRYGSSSIEEMVAEGWAEYTTSKNPRPISKRIGEIIEEVVSDARRGTQTGNG